MKQEQMFRTDLHFFFSLAGDEVWKRYSRYPCDNVDQLGEEEALVGLKGRQIDPPMLGRGEVKKDIGDDDISRRVAIYVLNASNVSSFQYKAEAGASYAGTQPQKIKFDEASGKVTLVFQWPDEVAASEVREWYEKYRGWMEGYLESLRVETNEYNKRLQEYVRSLIAGRKAECAKRVDIVKDL